MVLTMGLGMGIGMGIGMRIGIGNPIPPTRMLVFYFEIG
jgi:hypothetical protein